MMRVYDIIYQDTGILCEERSINGGFGENALASRTPHFPLFFLCERIELLYSELRRKL